MEHENPFLFQSSYLPDHIISTLLDRFALIQEVSAAGKIVADLSYLNNEHERISQFLRESVSEFEEIAKSHKAALAARLAAKTAGMVPHPSNMVAGIPEAECNEEEGVVENTFTGGLNPPL